jgi:hypothetical protein
MKIPDTDSIRDLAAFWDKHDLTEFEAELEEVPEPVFANALRVPLNLEERLAIQKMAASRGVPEGSLIREWVLEKLHR